MKIALSCHQHKGAGLYKALQNAGHTMVDARTCRDKDVDFLLIDFDGNLSHYPNTIHSWNERHAQVVLYQHGAEPLLIWDGIQPVSPYSVCYFAQSEGVKEVMEAYGYPLPIFVIGWHFSPILPWRPPAKIERVTFAPWHPLGNGFLHKDRARYNERVHDLLVEASQRMGFHLTVRHIHMIQANGIMPAEGVTYKRAHPDGNTDDIESADVVVALGTYAYMSVAMGKPTVFFGQDLRPLDGHSPSTCYYVRNWEKYRHIMRYPIDIDDGGPVDRILERACKHEPSDWKRKFIGKPLDIHKMTDVLERIKRGQFYG